MTPETPQPSEQDAAFYRSVSEQYPKLGAAREVRVDLVKSLLHAALSRDLWQ